FHSYCHHSVLPSLPTRRSSDLYRYRIVVDLVPPVHTYGQPIVGVFTPSGTPLVVITEPGTYSGVITASGTFSPLLQMTDALTSSAAIISEAYLLEIPDAYEPAELNPITLTEYFSEILGERFGAPQSSWSQADLMAIDTDTGYAG